MPTVTFIDAEGSRSTVSASAGASVMQTALDSTIAGIVGECGGNCACATCHVYVDHQWVAKLPHPEDVERIMLDLTHAPRKAQSRLACQIALTQDLDGIVVHIPQSQR